MRRLLIFAAFLILSRTLSAQMVAVYADLLATNPNEPVTQLYSWGKVDCTEQVQVFLEVILTESASLYHVPYEVARDNRFGIGTVTGGSEYYSKSGKCYQTLARGSSPTNTDSNSSFIRCDPTPPPPPPILVADCLESPIIIDVDSGEYTLTSLDGGVAFDIDADGHVERVSWIAGSTALLVLDRNGNGVIDNGRELFGSATLLASGLAAPNGFAALKELDANDDWLLDSRDPMWARLALWTDGNQNGISESDELRTLDSSSVTALEIDYERVGRRDRWGNLLRFAARAAIGDATRPYYDVYFVTERR